jgi:uncharacterized protein
MNGSPDRPGRLLAVTGGHRYDAAAFAAALDDVTSAQSWVWAHAEQPTAQQWLAPEHAGMWDAILLHDIAGLPLRRGSEPVPIGPSPEQASAIVALLDAGQPLLVTHHAVSSWPAWQGWAEIVGARFHYRPGVLRGRRRPGSGYRMSSYRVCVADPAHPLAQGMDRIEFDDELYHFDVLDDVIHPVLRADADFDGALFTYTYDEVCQGAPTGRTCAAQGVGPDVIAWTTVAGRSPIAVVQPGDGPATFANPGYRTLLGNALRWLTDPAVAAHAWANPRSIDATSLEGNRRVGA